MSSRGGGGVRLGILYFKTDMTTSPIPCEVLLADDVVWATPTATPTSAEMFVDCYYVLLYLVGRLVGGGNASERGASSLVSAEESARVCVCT